MSAQETTDIAVVAMNPPKTTQDKGVSEMESRWNVWEARDAKWKG